MSQIEEIADLLQQIVNLSDSPVITATATRALELADEDIARCDVSMSDAERKFLKAQKSLGFEFSTVLHENLNSLYEYPV